MRTGSHAESPVPPVNPPGCYGDRRGRLKCGPPDRPRAEAPVPPANLSNCHRQGRLKCQPMPSRPADSARRPGGSTLALCTEAESGCTKADFCEADLCEANLCEADCEADLCEADCETNLREAGPPASNADKMNVLYRVGWRLPLLPGSGQDKKMSRNVRMPSAPLRY